MTSAPESDWVRRRRTLTLAVGTALVIGVSAIAIANGKPYVSICPLSNPGSNCPGRLIVDFGGGVVPKKLPKHEVAPVALKLWGKVSTDNGTHPSALRELTIDFDRGAVVNAKGLPVCHPFMLRRDIRDLREKCMSAIIGGGRANFEYGFPDQAPIPVPGNLIVYNGGVKDGITTLYAVSFTNMPGLGAIMTSIKMTRINEGRYGLRAVAKIPSLAGGFGSLLGFSLKVKRLFNYKGTQESYATARCPDNRLRAEISTIFKNEAATPRVPSSTVIKGALVLPCAPRG